MRISRTLGVAVFALVLIFLISYANADVMASTSKSWSRLEADQDALFSIDQDNIPFTEIKFTLKNMTDNVDIELNVLSSNDTLIEAPAPDKVYEYIRLIPTNMQTSNIKSASASIQFRVANAWISDNNIKKDTIALYRYETSWSGLETSLASEDDNYIYYEAPVEKFSMFAIAGEKGEAQLLCTPGEKECTLNDLYQCSSDGMSWNLTENCAYGCEAGACRTEPSSCPECPEAGKVCSLGEQKCSGNDLQRCKSDGTGWEMVRDCPGGCAMCLEEGTQQPQTDTNAIYMATLIYQIVIGILIVVVIALIAYLRLHKH